MEITMTENPVASPSADGDVVLAKISGLREMIGLHRKRAIENWNGYVPVPDKIFIGTAAIGLHTQKLSGE